ncbi:DUF305 domain-containing protein [Nibrella saemangeumensis]|uniref:DUF305 domain-containing protein n=2 Tax=Nibrella saemangeumensis TaxID=1084526 RepID=A0ABP8NDB1_9BACT
MAFSLTTYSQSEHAGHSTMKSSDAMMHSMQAGMDQMMNMKMTGDPDHDFASMMKMHHQSAVEMSNLEIKQGKSQAVKDKAAKIKAANQKEITELTQFLNTHKPTASASKFGQSAMQMMHNGKKHSMTSNIDKDYALMMIQHHQQGIDMARAFLKEGKTDKMKALANKIIKDQTKDIEDLKSLQNRVAAR